MKWVLINSLVCGFILGLFMFGLATLGLGSAFFEKLRPVLAPGLYAARLFVQGAPGPSIGFIIFMNGLLFTVLFIPIFLSRFVKNKN